MDKTKSTLNNKKSRNSHPAMGDFLKAMDKPTKYSEKSKYSLSCGREGRKLFLKTKKRKKAARKSRRVNRRRES